MAYKLMDDTRTQELITEIKTRLAGKVDTESGKGLSTNDYTTNEKNKLAAIEAEAEVNVLESLSVNGTAATVTSKNIELTDVLGDLAFKDEVGSSDLDSSLSSTISGKADAATTIAGYGITDAYTKTETDTLLGAKADLASPTFTGTPAAPTATAGTNTTQIATTAFVKTACDAISQSLAGAFSFKGVVANLTELEAIVDPANGDVYQVTNPGTGKTNAEYAYNGTTWVELGTEIDLSGYAPLASPVFTGTPTAPTPTSGDDSTKIATTAYVQDELESYVPASDITIITAQELAAMWT